ncbi:MAG: EpsG family protein [Paludibacter sp.]|nr:EpsG family protein [Paludibacter sp.]
MPYSIPYIFLIIFLFLLSLLQLSNYNSNEIGNKSLNYIALIAFILFFGFRGFIGYDCMVYYPFFEKLSTIQQLNLTQYTGSFDIGFVIYASIIKTIYADFHFFIFSSTILDVILLSFFFKRYLNKRYFIFGFLMFLGFYGFLLEIEQIRNVKSLLLFLISIKYIENRNLFKFMLFNILGILFHWSSIFLIPLYFFINKKTISLRWFLIILILGNIVFILQLEFIKPIVHLFGSLLGGTFSKKVDFYLMSKVFSNSYGLSIGYFERVFTAILIAINYNKLMNSAKYMNIFLNSYFIFIFIELFCSELTIAIERVAPLYGYSYWILLPMLIYSYKDILNKQMIYIGVIIFIVIKFWVGTDVLHVYDNVLFGKMKSFKERSLVFDKNAKSLREKNLKK